MIPRGAFVGCIAFSFVIFLSSILICIPIFRSSPGVRDSSIIFTGKGRLDMKELGYGVITDGIIGLLWVGIEILQVLSRFIYMIIVLEYFNNVSTVI